MDPRRRELMLKVVNGCSDQRVLTALYWWDQHHRCDDVLRWLIKNRLTGYNLVTWLDEHYSRSILEPLKWILMRVDRGNEMRTIFDRDLGL